MILYLARHGNTFSSGDTITWVGRGQNPALTSEGREQARSVANALRGRSVKPTAVYCASLKRTREFAEIIVRESAWTDVPLIVEDRLLELDYGSWAGRSDAEVRAAGFGDDLDRWSQDGIWPVHSQWIDTQQTIEEELRALWRELLNRHSASERLLLVSSNGRLRFLAARSVDQRGERLSWSESKMGTGRISRIDVNGPTGTVRYWNAPPGEFAAREQEAKGSAAEG